MIGAVDVQHSHWLCILSVLHISAALATSRTRVADIGGHYYIKDIVPCGGLRQPLATLPAPKGSLTEGKQVM